MIRFILHTDFDCDAKFMYHPEVSLSVFSVKDYVRDYMSTYGVRHLELYMSQNPSVHFEYQFDVYAQFSDEGSLTEFYTTRHLEKEKCRLHFDSQEVF